MKPLLIGLAGITGAGKSTLADHLEAQGGVKRFRVDAYYKNDTDCPKLEDGRPHWDLPESLHLEELYAALSELREGREIFLPVYDRGQNKRIGTTLFEPRPVIFAEGLQIFSEPRTRNLFDLRLWLDVPEEIATQRRVQRQPNYDLAYHYAVALPAQRRDVLPFKQFAHAVLDGTKSIREVTGDADTVLRKFLGM